MPSIWPVARAQAALGEIAFELLALQERLAAINRTLPVPPNQDDMLEGRIAPDLATEVSGRIEVIADDYLRQVIDSLQGAATVTAHDLMQDFREQQKRRRREWR
jgi:LPS O-antigen subunit length determinant protein (WzzB/FepE family)